MARYTVNPAGVERAKRMIEARQYVLTSDWGEVQPRAEDENAYLERHDWDDYGSWHLGLTDGANDETKARYAFGFGDFRRDPPDGPHRLRVPGVGVAPQGGRAGRPRPAPAPRCEGRHRRPPGAPLTRRRLP